MSRYLIDKTTLHYPNTTIIIDLPDDNILEYLLLYEENIPCLISDFLDQNPILLNLLLQPLIDHKPPQKILDQGCNFILFSQTLVKI